MGLLIRSLRTGRTAGRLQTAPILAAYSGNVRSILEYGCVIWGGAAPSHLERLDKIQHKFLTWLAFYAHASQPSQSLSYHDLLKQFKVVSLSQRRFQLEVCFVHKIICGRVNSAYLLGSIPLHVPRRRTRGGQLQLLHVPDAREANKETIKRGLFRRAILAFKEHVSRFAVETDPFATTYAGFRVSVKKYVRKKII